jgi:16S rRNA (adenine1518-N6/adenine1519-N6)-dimethyltransferase
MSGEFRSADSGSGDSGGGDSGNNPRGGGSGGPLRPKKMLGQNFLCDPNLIRKIIAAVDPKPGDVILEYGCGTGALTRPLVASGARVIGVEIDRDLIVMLGKDPELAGLELRTEGLEHWPPALLAGELHGEPLKVVGNLPYQLSSTALFAVADGAATVERVVFMLQREVAERIQTGPGSKRFGILPALIQARFAVSKVLDAGPKAFFPSPDVKSRVLCLTPLPEFAVSDELWPRYREMVKLIFRERRKQLGTLLKKFYPLSDSFLVELKQREHLDPSRRPETLSIEELARLVASLPESRA